jgi:hypothetical protein
MQHFSSNSSSSSSTLHRGMQGQPQHGRSIFQACVTPGGISTLYVGRSPLLEQTQHHVLTGFTFQTR